jgi:uncharacterized membrane protein YuzA (DUF378 family)
LDNPWTVVEKKEAHVKKLEAVAFALILVGALNWGLVALAEFDLVATLVGLEFGETNAVSRIVYGLVGLAAVYEIALLLTNRARLADTRRTPASAPR